MHSTAVAGAIKQTGRDVSRGVEGGVTASHSCCSSVLEAITTIGADLYLRFRCSEMENCAAL
jgi:hypothetical protein